jgi:hypothetical protein
VELLETGRHQSGPSTSGQAVCKSCTTPRGCQKFVVPQQKYAVVRHL